MTALMINKKEYLNPKTENNGVPAKSACRNNAASNSQIAFFMLVSVIN